MQGEGDSSRYILRTAPATASVDTEKHENTVGIEENEKKWRPRRDLNPCRRRERPVSWARLDDGDAREATLLAAAVALLSIK